jgi:hypothetical protein
MRSFCLLLVVPFAAAAAVLKESKNTDNSTSHTPNKAPIKLVLSNDDGWAEINIREFFHSLNDAGFTQFSPLRLQIKVWRNHSTKSPSKSIKMAVNSTPARLMIRPLGIMPRMCG